jgi:LPXTG-site transpeptidase (sortase) family protein
VPTLTAPLTPLAEFPLGAIAVLSLPRLDATWPVFETSWELISMEGQLVGQWQQAETGAGHCLGTAKPGEQGNCVLSLGSEAGAGLERIAELTVGDQIVIDSGLDQWTYRLETVTKVREVGASLAERRENAQFMASSEDRRLTLIACWPDWACTHRLVLVAVQ